VKSLEQIRANERENDFAAKTLSLALALFVFSYRSGDARARKGVIDLSLCFYDVNGKISPPVSSLFSRESAEEEEQHHQV